MDSRRGNRRGSPPPVQETHDPQTGSYSFGLSSTNPAGNIRNDGLSDPSLPTRRPTQLNLDQCTETLGSETGSVDVFDESFPSSSIPNSRSQRPGKKQQKNEFPPPLTTMTGPNRVRHQSQREDGRLVIKEVSVPPSRSSFQAIRSDGRLRLRFRGSTEKTEEEEEEKDDVSEEQNQ